MGARPEASYVAHECRGRLRLRVPHRRGEVEFFRTLAARVAAAAGVVGVDANPATGTILILHVLGGDGVREKLAAAGGLAITAGPVLRRRAVVSDVRRFAAGLDRDLTRITAGEFDLWAASFAVLLALGLNELRRGNIAAPAWYTAFWYAFNILLKTPAPAGQED
jgi:hypothetical protein